MQVALLQDGSQDITIRGDPVLGNKPLSCRFLSQGKQRAEQGSALHA